MKGTRKRGRPRKRGREEFEKDLNLKGVKKKQAKGTDCPRRQFHNALPRNAGKQIPTHPA